MAQFLSQEVSQELDCKDNQNNNDGCQNDHIVIVTIEYIGMDTLPIPPAPTAPAIAVSPTREIKVTVVTRIKSGRPSSKPDFPRLKFFTRKTSFF